MAFRCSVSFHLIGVILACSSAPAEAQTVKFGRLGLDDGMSDEVVFDIVQDVEGFLWVATQRGLNRYDGRSFRSDWGDGAEISPVSYGWVRTLFVDSAGQLWVGVDDHGLFRYDRAREEFRSIRTTPPVEGVAASLRNVWDIEEHAGALVVATSVGLASVDSTADGVVLRWSTADGGCSSAPTALWSSDDGGLWVGTEDGCLYVQGNPPRLLSPSTGLVHQIAPGNGDTVWVASDRSGLRRLDLRGTSLAPLPSEATSGGRREAWSVLTDRFGETWVGTMGGLGRHPGGASTWVGLGREEDGGLPRDVVLSLYEDREGVLWVGTLGGLARIGPTRRFIGFVAASSFGASGGGVIGIGETPAGHVWFGGVGGFLQRFDDGDLDARTVLPLPSGVSGDVLSVAVVSEDEMWIAIPGTGLHHRKADRWRSYRGQTGRPRSLPDDDVVAVAVDRAGHVWAGSNNHGLFAYDEQADRFERFAGPEADFEYLAPYIWPIIEDSVGFLWFGANGVEGGVHSLSPDRTKLDTYRTGAAHTGVPNSGQVISLALSGDTLVWFGTQGGGLGVIDRRSAGGVRMYTVQDGLPNNGVAGIVEDRFGFVWASTEGGLTRFDPSTEEFWVFRDGSGLQSNRFYFTSAFASANGLIYFGGSNGLTVIDPSAAIRPVSSPRAALTRFLVQGEARPELNHLTTQAGVELAPDERFFTLELAALDFTDVTLNEFRYQLRPLQSAWQGGGTNAIANYTSVPPGEYTFVAEVRNGAGIWSSPPLQIPLRVEPYLYEEAWFTPALLVALLLGAALVGRRQLHRQSERHEEAIRVERVRTAERERLELERREMLRRLRFGVLSVLHSDVGADLGTIVLKAGSIAAAGSGRSVRDISGQIERIAQGSMQTIRELLTVLDERRDTVSGLAGQLQDQTKRLLDGVVDDYDVEIDDAASASRTRVDMELRSHVVECYKEALQNVQKHAEATAVRTRVSLLGAELLIAVVDDGVGFDLTTVQEGHGLRIGGEVGSDGTLAVTWDSEPGHGTCCKIRVRLVGRSSEAETDA